MKEAWVKVEAGFRPGREMILAKKSAAEVKRKAREEGMVFLRDSAVAKALAGHTTLHEINKVTFVEVT